MSKYASLLRLRPKPCNSSHFRPPSMRDKRWSGNGSFLISNLIIAAPAKFELGIGRKIDFIDLNRSVCRSSKN